jgi:large subunit ribosomal protein L17
MRHRKTGVKLNRSSSHRQAMFRNMVTSLLKHDRIKTTDVRAKELSRWADRIITLAKRGDLHARRQAMSIVREKDVVHKIFEEAKARFGKRNGGYTRVVKLGRRPGDAALISIIELISDDDSPKKKKKKGKTTLKKTKAVAPEVAVQTSASESADEQQATPASKVKADAAEDTAAAEPPAVDTAKADAAAVPAPEAEAAADTAVEDPQVQAATQKDSAEADIEEAAKKTE